MSSVRGERTNRVLQMAQAGLAGFALGALLWGSLPPHSYRKDLQVEYLTAMALRDGVDLFTPLTDLSARYFPAATDNFPHPSPYPPVVALISLPLTLLPFPAVALLWLMVNIALLLVVGRWLRLSVLGRLALAAWPPLWCLLSIGQLELAMLALVMLGWRAAARGRDGMAGIWLGVVAAVKLYPALLLVPFAARRRVRLVMVAVGMFALSQLGSLVAVGPAGVVRYYGEVLPAVSARYTVMGLNSSPYGALLRLFGGATDVAPIAHAPDVVVPVSIALSLFALVALAKLEPEAAPVALVVALPAVWYYSVVVALPRVVALLRSPSLRRAALLATAAASFVLPLVNLVVGPLSKLMLWMGSEPSPMAVLLAIQPGGFVALLALCLLMARDRRRGIAAIGETSRPR